MVSSLYLHIPFCHTKCHYCSFSSWSGLHSLHKRYVEALKIELRLIAAAQSSPAPLETIFFGGGTPTVLSADDLADILALCKQLFALSKNPEISSEANPGTIHAEKLDILRRAGFNRLSIGVQSFSAQELQVLGRCHTPDEAVNGVEMARAAGFENISLDLMYGLPDQTPEKWKTSLETALGLQPDHLSMYQLTIEEGTPFADKLDEGALWLPEEESILAVDDLNIEKCSAAGLHLYEISNFARPGFKCRHNINYWENNEYLAAGAGAVSYLQGKRQRRIDTPQNYCEQVEAGQEYIVESEILSLEASFRETVIMGLRMTEGVSRDRIFDRYGIEIVAYYGAILDKLLEQQLVELTPTHLRVSKRGRLLSNHILSELV